MPAPNFLAADFLAAMQALLPRGRIWNRDANSVQTKVLNGLAPSYERQTARANNLLTDAFPATAYELLPEWESTLGLPDSCAGTSPTVAQRRQQVIARLTNEGGASIAYLIAFAAALGYTVTITQFAQARTGMLKAGDACYGYDWNFAWKVIAPLTTIVRDVAGAMAAGDPLAAWGNDVLECEIKAIAPAHTIPIFAYE